MTVEGLRRSATVPAIAMLAATAVAPVTATPARADTLVVGGSGWPTISRAIAAARPGDIVIVKEGLYRENLVINKTVRLLGRGRAVIEGDGRGDVITVTAPGTVIEGLTITGSGRRLEDDPAGIKVSADDVTVQRNRLVNNIHGIYVLNASGPRLLENLIEGMRERGLEDRGDAIHLFNTRKGVIRGNRFRYIRDGVYLDYAQSFLVADNLAEDARYGIHSMNAGKSLFRRNVLAKNIVGAALMLSRALTFEANRLSANRDPRSAGILVKDSDDLVITDNVISGSTRGLFMDNANRCRVRGNTFALNGIGLAIAGDSSDNAFTLNSFIGNLQDLEMEQARANNKWNEGGRGNFWDSYGGYDFNGDGVGDVPFRSGGLFSHLTASFPELHVLAGSPALTAVEWAEKAFPVFAVPVVTDPAPLLRPRLPTPARRLPIGRVRTPYTLLLLAAILTVRGGLRRDPRYRSVKKI